MIENVGKRRAIGKKSRARREAWTGMIEVRRNARRNIVVRKAVRLLCVFDKRKSSSDQVELELLEDDKKKRRAEE